MVSSLSASQGQGSGPQRPGSRDLRGSASQAAAPAVPSTPLSVEERREAAPAGPGLRRPGERLRMGRTWEFGWPVRTGFGPAIKGNRLSKGIECEGGPELKALSDNPRKTP